MGRAALKYKRSYVEARLSGAPVREAVRKASGVMVKTLSNEVGHPLIVKPDNIRGLIHSFPRGVGS